MIIIGICLLVIVVFSFLCINVSFNQSIAVATNEEEKKYIKWVSFNVTYPVLKKALDLDVSSQKIADL
jgi:hypothetical protein